MNNRTLPYLLLLPATLFLLVFFVYPFVQVAVQAFTLPGGGGFTTQNVQTMLRNFRFWPSLRNTLLLAAIVVPLQLVMALAMATVVARLKSARDTILYIFTIPLGLSDLAAGIIWAALWLTTGLSWAFTPW